MEDYTMMQLEGADDEPYDKISFLHTIRKKENQFM